MTRVHSKGTPYVACTLPDFHVTLHLCSTHSQQRIRQTRQSQPSPERLSQQSRLIVASAQQAPSMQRHRHQKRRLRPISRARPDQPWHERLNGISLITVLEPQYQPSAVVIINQCRPGAPERRRINQTFGTLKICPFAAPVIAVIAERQRNSA